MSLACAHTRIVVDSYYIAILFVLSIEEMLLNWLKPKQSKPDKVDDEEKGRLKCDVVLLIELARPTY